MADRILLPRATDTNGDIVAGATAYFYEAGTTTEALVYADSDAATPHGYTLSANSEGVFPEAFSTQQLKVDIRDGDGVSLPGYPSDEWYIVPSSGGTAASIVFTPVDAGAGYEANPATDVQNAIENNTQNFANYQPKDDQLTALANTSPSNNKIPKFTSATSIGLLDYKDEDDMASNSADAVASQQSIKAYVDNEITASEVSERKTWATAVTTSSGTVVDFTGITANVRSIEVVFHAVSTSGTDDIIIQLGDSGGFEATGYASSVEYNGNQTTDTTGFIVTRLTAATDTFSGVIILRCMTPSAGPWVQSGMLDNGGWSSGRKTLSDTLTQLRITTTGGTDTFDAGQININYTLY